MNRICTGTQAALKATIGDLNANLGRIHLYLEHSTYIQFLINVSSEVDISMLAKTALGRFELLTPFLKNLSHTYFP